MSVNIDTVYQRVQAIANKSQVGSYLDPIQFNLYANWVNVGLANAAFSQFQRFQKMTDQLKSFIVKKAVSVNQYGQLVYPNKYLYFIALRSYKRENLIALKSSCIDDSPTQLQYAALPKIPVKLVDNDKIAVLNQSEKYTPNYEYPYAVQYEDYFQLYPIDIGVAELDFLRKPNDVEWTFTYDTYSLPVYNPLTSINFEWGDEMINQIVLGIAQHFGIEIRDADLVQATSQLEATGE